MHSSAYIIQSGHQKCAHEAYRYVYNATEYKLHKNEKKNQVESCQPRTHAIVQRQRMFLFGWGSFAVCSLNLSIGTEPMDSPLSKPFCNQKTTLQTIKCKSMECTLVVTAAVHGDKSVRTSVNISFVLLFKYIYDAYWRVCVHCRYVYSAQKRQLVVVFVEIDHGICTNRRAKNYKTLFLLFVIDRQSDGKQKKRPTNCAAVTRTFFLQICTQQMNVIAYFRFKFHVVCVRVFVIWTNKHIKFIEMLRRFVYLLFFKWIESDIFFIWIALRMFVQLKFPHFDAKEINCCTHFSCDDLFIYLFFFHTRKNDKAENARLIMNWASTNKRNETKRTKNLKKKNRDDQSDFDILNI